MPDLIIIDSIACSGVDFPSIVSLWTGSAIKKSLEIVIELGSHISV